MTTRGSSRRAAIKQHDDAASKAQTTRQQLFAQLLAGLNQDAS